MSEKTRTLPEFAAAMKQARKLRDLEKVVALLGPWIGKCHREKKKASEYDRRTGKPVKWVWKLDDIWAWEGDLRDYEAHITDSVLETALHASIPEGAFFIVNMEYAIEHYPVFGNEHGSGSAYFRIRRSCTVED